MNVFRALHRLPSRWRLAAAVMVILALAAPVAAQEEIVLEVWHVWTGAREPLMQEIARRFEQAHPGVKVNAVLTHPTSAAQGIERLALAWATGIGPDVAMVNPSHIMSFASNGYLLAVDDLAAREGVRLEDLVHPSLVAEIRNPLLDGKAWYVPMFVSTSIMYHNRQIFAEAGLDPDSPPATLNELYATARRLTMSPGGGPPTVLGFQPLRAEWVNNFRLLEGIMHQYGTTTLSYDGRTVLGDLDKAVEVLQWLTDFADAVGGRPLPGGFLIQNKNVAMAFLGDDFWYTAGQRWPELDLGMSLLPRPEGEPVRTMSTPAWGWAVFKNTPHPELAWELAKWLGVHPDGGGWFVQQQGRISTNAAVTSDPENFRNHPYWPVMVDTVLNATKSGIACPGFGDQEIQQVIGTAMLSVANAEESPRQALERVQRTLQARCDEWWAANR